MSKEIFRGKGVGRGTVIGELRPLSHTSFSTSAACPTEPTSAEQKPERVIVLCGNADDLTHLPADSLLGVVCHPATIGIRRIWEMGIPMLITDTDALPISALEGKNAILDAAYGRLTVDPDLEALEEFSKRIRQRDNEEAKLLEQEDLPSVTLSGRQVSVLTRIGNLSRPASTSEGGILLTVENEIISELSEEEQYKAYRRLAPKQGALAVRTLTGFRLSDEGGGNNADRSKEMQKRQLRALLRAAAESPISAVLSGVSCPEEARRRQALLVEAKNELRYDCIPFGERMPCGILLDTPKAVMLSDLLGAETEFFLFDTELLSPDSKAPWDNGRGGSAEAVLRLLEIAAKGHLAGRSAPKKAVSLEESSGMRRHPQWSLGICGALSCDEGFLAGAVALGIDFAALPPPFTAVAKSVIREQK